MSSVNESMQCEWEDGVVSVLLRSCPSPTLQPNQAENRQAPIGLKAWPIRMIIVVLTTDKEKRAQSLKRPDAACFKKNQE